METDRNRSYLIDIKGSGHERQRFEFPLDMAFFDSMGNNRIKDVEDLLAIIEINRSKSRTGLTLSITGEIIVECDRCLEDITLPTDIEKDMTIRFSGSEDDESIDDEDVIIISNSSGEMDASQLIYDTIILSIPIVSYHDDNECNEDIVRLLDSDAGEEGEKITPLSNLKDLMNKNS